ncbi:MAG: 3-hydroxyacyl-ACP dehydratase FabZ, partial [Candidatus Aminicenantes bacterium]|nr:3-hydroxyacyl-ACP dehydratase FabZ [Candidatus Aminicenantes bacterium]
MEGDKLFDIEEIKKIIPHRYPFLLVDRITEINGMESVKGYKNITFNEPIFQGHFPQRAVFPGVLIIEAMAQLGAVLILRLFPEEQRMAYFTGIERAKFKRVVIPGDKLDLELKVLRHRELYVVMEGKAFVDGQVAAQATMSSMLVKNEHGKN